MDHKSLQFQLAKQITDKPTDSTFWEYMHHIAYTFCDCV